MNDFQRVSNRVLAAVFGVFCLTALYVLLAGRQTQRVGLLQPTSPGIESGWYYLGYYEKRFDIKTLPAKIPAADGEAAIYYDLPQSAGSERYLCFTTHHQDVTVNIDGTVIYRYETKPAPRWLKTYRALNHLVPLPENAAPAQLCIRQRALIKSYAGSFSEVLLGNKADLLTAVLYRSRASALFGLCLVVAALFLAGTSYLFMHTNHSDFTLLHLALLTLCIGLWQLEDSQLLQLVIGYQPLRWCMEYLSQLFIPLLTFLFLRSISEEKHTRPMQGIFWATVSVTGLQFLLQVTGLFALTDTVFLSHLVYVSTCVYMVIALSRQEWLRASKLRHLFAGSLACSTLIFAFTFFSLARNQYHSGVTTLGLAITFFSMILLAYKKQLKHFEAVKQAETYQNLAFTDLATGVSNKTAWFTRIDNFNERSPQGEYCIMLFDMNNLKKINDVHGHLVGDQVIKAFCDCLSRVVGEKGTIYRVGGDEFICLCYNVQREDITTMLYKFDVAVESQNKTEFPFSAAYGYRFFTPHSRLDFEQAQEEADARMYEHKVAMKSARRS